MLPVIARRTGCDDWRIFLPSRKRRESSVHFIASATFQTPRLVVKIQEEDFVSPAQARRLFQRAQNCHRRSTGEFSVPAPVMFFPRFNAMAMEYVDAPLLSRHLLRRLHVPGARAVAIRGAARWLRWFHEGDGIDERPFRPGVVAGHLDHLRGILENAAPGSLARDHRLGGLLGLSMEVAESLGGRTMPHATAHGDFTPFNLFAGGRRMIGFDYGGNARFPLYEDMCRFLSYMNIYRPMPASAADLARHGCHGRDFADFMEAYGSPVPFDAGLWRKLCFIETTRRILSLRPERPRMSVRYFRKLQSAILMRAARCMAKAL